MRNDKHDRISGRLTRDYIELADLRYIKDVNKALQARLKRIERRRRALKKHN